jgi:exodeoxyribonuclease VII large subunit
VSRRFFALSDVTERIAELLRPAFGRSFWLKAELSSGRERGHFYCDLVETDVRGEVAAQMRCTIWAQDLARIRESFKAAGIDLVLENGTQVGIECELQYHPRYGLSLVGRDMDPAFALGELELKRRRILEALERDGLFGRNALLPLSLLPNRIGLITSRGSAAYNDFVKTLSASGHGFRVFVADATMQGPDTQRSLLAALDACARLGLELVVIARGGGSKTDLAWLDDEILARHIASYPFPIWTGIGHEVDTSVLDAVAGMAFKTPTAVAEALASRFDTVAALLDDARARLRSIWQFRRDAERARIERAYTGLRQGSRKLLDLRRSDLLRVAARVRGEVLHRFGQERSRIEGARVALRARSRAALRERRIRLAEAGRTLGQGTRVSLRLAHERLGTLRRRLSLRRVLQRIESAREALSRKEQLVRAADPVTALGRGYSLTTNAAGALLRSIVQVAPGETVTTRVADGSFESVVRATRRDGDE